MSIQPSLVSRESTFQLFWVGAREVVYEGQSG